MGKKGQSVILFCLILSVVIVTLLGSIMISLQSFNKGVVRLKTRILGYQATVQISQIIQQGLSTAVKYPTCVVNGVSMTPVVVGSKLLCLPADKICINNQFKYCVAKDVSYSISQFSPPTSESLYSKLKNSFDFDFDLLPKAYAQGAPKVWLPIISSGAPTVSIAESGFPANKAAICRPAADMNSDCFKVRICTNGSESCSSADDYIEALVAVVFQKN